jgi:hypothetical protein
VHGPTLVHIGYHKTGTTWLQQSGFSYLEGVTVYSRQRLVSGLFHDLINQEKTPAPALLRTLAEQGGPQLYSDERFSGNLWTGGGEAVRTAARLHEAFPEGTVLVTVRAQQSIIRSVYAQYVNEGGWVSFDRFLNCDAPGLHWNPDHFAYDRLISVYHELFSGRVIVLPYELLRTDAVAYLGAVASVLQTRLTARPNHAVVNPSLSGWQLSLLRGWNRAARASPFNPKPLVAVPGAARMRGVMQARARGRGGESPLPEDLLRRYAERNRQISRYCTLTGLGYPGMPGI